MKYPSSMVEAGDRSNVLRVPNSVLVAGSVAILFLALLALEISDGLIKHGAIARSVLFFPPVLLLVWGILAHRRWAWLAARGSALLFALVFWAVGVIACVLQPRDQYGPVWIWIAGVSFVLAGCLSAGFVALGRPSAKAHYRLDCPACHRGITGLWAYFARNPTCRACGHIW